MCGILFQHTLQSQPNVPQLIKTTEFPTYPITTEIPNQDATSQTFQNIIPLIHNRGPDHARLISTESWCAFSSVLSLRAPFTKQPIFSNQMTQDLDDGMQKLSVSDNGCGYVLQFNGELYDSEIRGNDSVFFMDMIKKYGVVEGVKRLEGEFAYVIHDLKNRIVYFGRDSIGKRSLVYKIDIDQETGNTGADGLIIASLSGKANSDGFSDCLAGVIYSYDLKSNELKEDSFKKNYVIKTEIDEGYSGLRETLEGLDKVLRDAVSCRTHAIEPLHHKDINNHDAEFAVLFSGGLDCTVIAALAAECSSEGTIIDLLNVGFDNPRTKLKACEAPDRKLAISSAVELNKKYEGRVKFKLREIDVSYEEYLDKKDYVQELMWPKNTEMDLSIAIAFYFASRQLNDRDYPNGKPKVLLSGLGADELYGGYHKLNNKSIEELSVELTRQINNIHERNLQRDDKVIADNGVEVRYPFLCEPVVKYSTESIEINYKVNKFGLRQYARLMLELEWIWEEPKRAIQFGAKSAKMSLTSGKSKGTDALI